MSEIDFPNSPAIGQEYHFGSSTWVWSGVAWNLKSASGGSGGTFDPSLVAYTHIQAVPSAVWTILHNLGYAPGGISVLDSAGTMVEGDVAHVSLNECTISFSAGFAGTAYLS